MHKARLLRAGQCTGLQPLFIRRQTNLYAQVNGKSALFRLYTPPGKTEPNAFLQPHLKNLIKHGYFQYPKVFLWPLYDTFTERSLTANDGPPDDGLATCSRGKPSQSPDALSLPGFDQRAIWSRSPHARFDEFPAKIFCTDRIAALFLRQRTGPATVARKAARP